MSTGTFSPDLAAMEAELRSKRGWFVAVGVVLLVLGILALGNLLAATLTSVFFVGIMMILGGVAQVIHAFQMKGWGGFFLLAARRPPLRGGGRHRLQVRRSAIRAAVTITHEIPTAAFREAISRGTGGDQDLGFGSSRSDFPSKNGQQPCL